MVMFKTSVIKTGCKKFGKPGGSKAKLFRKPIKGLLYDVLMSFMCLTKVVEITLFKMNLLRSGRGVRWKGNKSHPKPSGFRLHILHFMALEIIQDDNIVNRINYHESLFLGVLDQIVRKTVF
jgi:hypothetical protein